MYISKIVGGLRYNTSTAEEICAYESDSDRGDFRHQVTTLFRTPRGRFFLADHALEPSGRVENLPTRAVARDGNTRKTTKVNSMKSKARLNTPPELQELRGQVRKLTKQALVLAPAAFVVGGMFGATGMKTMWVAFWTISISCVVSTLMVHVLMTSLEYLTARKNKS